MNTAASKTYQGVVLLVLTRQARLRCCKTQYKIILASQRKLPSWINGKQRRYWSDAEVCNVLSRFTSFAQACLS